MLSGGWGLVSGGNAKVWVLCFVCVCVLNVLRWLPVVMLGLPQRGLANVFHGKFTSDYSTLCH